MLLLCALVVGTRSSWAVDVVYKTQQFSNETYSAGVSSYAGSFSNTYGGFTCNYTNFNNNNKGWTYVKCGSSSAAYTGTIITNAAIDKAITKVEIKVDAITVDYVNSIKLYTSSSKSGSWTEVGTFDKSSGTKSVSINSPATNKFYKIAIDCAKGTNGAVTLSKIDYYMAPDTKWTVSYNDGGSDTEANPGDGVTLPVRSNPAGSTFVGWSETNISPANNVAPTIFTGTYNPTSNITLYPVYRYKATRPAKGWKEVKATDIEDGTYAICASTYFMKAATSNSRFTNGSSAPSYSASGDELTVAPTPDCTWEIYKKNDGYYRIKNGSKYAGAAAKNTGALLDNEDADKAKWTIVYSSGFTFTNYGRTQDSDPNNCYLRNNTTAGWASYTSGTGVAPRLFIKCDGGLTETFYISSIPATSATVTLASACTDGDFYYGTYSNNRAFVVPDDVIVSEIKVVDGKLSVSNYETGDVVPANTGVMISSYDAGEHTLTFSSDAGTSIYGSGNMLKPSGNDGVESDYMNEDNTLFYRLTMHNAKINPPGQIGFWYGAANGAAFDIAANKAYLAVPTGVSAKEGFTFEDTTTGINGVEEIAPVTKTRKVVKNGRLVIETANGEFTIDGARVK